MSKHRTAVVLAVAAAAGVLGTSAGCLLHHAGTYAYFTDSTSIGIRITTQRHESSPGTKHPGHHARADDPPAHHGQHRTSPGDDVPGRATPKPAHPPGPPTVPPSPGTGPTNDSGHISSGRHPGNSPQTPPDTAGHPAKRTADPKPSKPTAGPQPPKPTNGADPHVRQMSRSGSADRVAPTPGSTESGRPLPGAARHGD